MNSSLKKAFRFYLENQKDLVKRYNGKFLVIKGHEFLGAFDDEITAIKETSKNHEMGTFLVQLAEPGEEAYTQIYHSRVAFA
ncbi:MAG: hypothetical protein WCS65_12460 [Verrucomicrobiae bacterium]